jgi:alanyl-tRNA synthetase
MMTAALGQQSDLAQIKQRFVEHYCAEGYAHIPGSSLLDPSVPMSYVMSAGLVQVETSATLHGGRTGTRYTLVQNCFRYFDMAKVGHSAMHLSLFQMPGAFTFGPANRTIAIARIWQLLIDGYGFSPDSLWATFFAGGAATGHHFEPDWETQRAWIEVGMVPEHIVGLEAEHNFWKQGASVVGDTQAPKCGPNTEVFFDRGTQLSCGPTCAPGCTCGRFVEFLNTLFITMHIDGIIEPLAEPFTETVVGAERVAMLLQGAASIYEIDTVHPLMAMVREAAGTVPPLVQDGSIHERVIVDHIRALLFLTADGAPRPGKGGRARLMRKLIRELLTSMRLLRIADMALVHNLANTVAVLETNPHLPAYVDKVCDYIAAEKTIFDRTVRAGMRKLEAMLEEGDIPNFNGADMVKMEKQHGVPRALVEIALRQKRVRFDPETYQKAYRQWSQSLAGEN